MMSQSIALVGLACVYPDACSPAELWENVLAGRRAFRRLPAERLRAEDYWSSDREAPDRTYAVQAAVIEGYEFDRVGFRVGGDSYRSADLAHWLALDVASRAMADAGFGQGSGLPRETTGVFLGNTLTGEFSRAQGLRLRWPYARRMIEAALCDEDWDPERRGAFLGRLEAQFKEPFAPVGEETLAGGLSNTIAGRICNHFDLKGGGYTVDGACASSLLAVAHACSSLASGDLDVALAGGVDLSLDPFELVGFAKAGALAQDAMRIFDARSAGFWPGEGCGVVVLMRLADAVDQGRRVVAVIRGWGISSDGQGGITRPEVEGQLLALRRAYRRAGFGIETVGYFEGHGTGTSVGDATELRALGRALNEAESRDDSCGDAPLPAIGSIKANIGHTKAAAGVAGLIKAALALDAQILPPTTGCEQPHPELAGDQPALRILRKGRPWPADRRLRAGVSAMGFGGINAHLALESLASDRREGVSPLEDALLASYQDAELFLLGACDTDSLRRQVDGLLAFAGRLSMAELTDLATHLAGTLEHRNIRAAIVASRPTELEARLGSLRNWLDRQDGIGNGTVQRPGVDIDLQAGVFLGRGKSRPRIGFLFPGQGSPATLDGGALGHRFASVESDFQRAGLPTSGDLRSTAVAQPAIVAASMAAIGLLGTLGIVADVAVGHSLGELTALHWAGAFDAGTLLRTAEGRGEAMAELGTNRGAMASLHTDQAEAEALLNGEGVVIAGLNAPRQTVISGSADAVELVLGRARRREVRSTRLAVSHAFHSPMVAGAVEPLARVLAREIVGPPRGKVFSTVTGAQLPPDVDVRELLLRQVTSPVRFLEAMAGAAEGIDLWIEAGPGRVLTGLVEGWLTAPVVAIELGGDTVGGLLRAAGMAFALGAPLETAPLVDRRVSRPFPIPWQPRFFASPCERAPLPQESPAEDTVRPESCPRPDDLRVDRALSVLELFRQQVAAKVELPTWSVEDGNRLLSDLHLNSIAVGQLVSEMARRLGAPPPVEPLAFADVTVAEVAEALEELARAGVEGHREEVEASPRGVAPWFRAFAPILAERPRPRRRSDGVAGPWRIIALPDNPMAGQVGDALSLAKLGRGVLVCLPPDPDERHIGLLLEAARAALEDAQAGRFVLVQHGGGASSFARTLALEAPRITACVVDVPVDHPQSAEWIVAEAEAASGFTEVHYDGSGRRRVPILRVLPWPEAPTVAQFGPTDVMLVTGGGKGIAAECALCLARETGVSLALIGRSRPETDAGLATNLGRMAGLGVRFHYIAADVVDAGAVRAAVCEAESMLGPITAVLHGAGVNVPRPIGSLDEAAFLKTLAPKLQGLRNLLAAVEPDRLKLLVTFGSIIARTGLRGEADYGVTNEWLARLTEQFQVRNPACRCLALEWSVWSGVGMGDRLGRVDALARQGITPITPDEGVSLFRRLVAVSSPSVSLILAGRFGIPPALPIEADELPLLRFLERPLVDYPGVELVAEATLATESDPYLDDHVFRGERLFPAVMGLEAMAQAAMAVLRTAEVPVFEELRFDRPIVVPSGRPTTIRLAALVTAPGRVDVVLRIDETAFQFDHFRAVCRFGDRAVEPPGNARRTVERAGETARIPIEPHTELYGHLLFQGGRFRRLIGYQRLRSTSCEAEIAVDDSTGWFHRYLSPTLVLGDPAARDAAIHAVQACIPQAIILPIGVDRLVLGMEARNGAHRVRARERSEQGDLLVYDLEITDEAGHVRERWEGLRLRVVERREPDPDWPAALLGPYLERRARSLLSGCRMAVEIERDGRTERRVRSDRLIRRSMGEGVPFARRPDGKPEAADRSGVSAAHSGDWTIGVAGSGTIACDLEPVMARPESHWRDLLGHDRWELARLVVRETGEPIDLSATRAWVALECLAKAGVNPMAPMVLERPDDGGAVVYGSGSFRIATFVVPDRRNREPLVLGLLARTDDASL
ncbi:MAG: SDR family NAD(P)-dependent oxidoreductase [Isosphaeraceae bacterium]